VVAVLFATAGALLLFRPDAQRAMNEPAFTITRQPGDQAVSLVGALRTVQRAHPEIPVGRVWFDGQVYRVFNVARSHWWSVDPGSGRILGHDGTALDVVWGVLRNLHTCMLTCSEYPGYQAWLTTVIPGTELELSQAVWGLVALTLIGLAVSGLWLGSAALRRALRVRWSRAGRFARDSDLHRLIGLVAGPFLIVWAITGSGFELPWVEQAWYALTPGAAPAVVKDTPAPAGHGPDIGLESAFQHAADLIGSTGVTGARGAGPGGAAVAPAGSGAAAGPAGAGTEPIFALLPTGSSSRYRFRFEAAPGTYGDVTDGFRVSVDRYSGRAVFEDNAPGSSAATVFWENWRFPIHSGIVAHGWWRLPWLIFGLLPLALLVTGVSASVFRRRAARDRRLARQRRGTPPVSRDHQDVRAV
jgi:uncharacterized iron-regulated membrane protein